MSGRDAGVATPSPRRRRALVGVTAAALVLAAILAGARSPRVRAAYLAFRDPARVHDGSVAPLDGAARSIPLPLEVPEPPGDFERATEEALADAGESTLTGLVLPDFPIPVSRRTMRFVAYFAARDKGRQAFAERFRRAGRYRAHIEQALRDAELPEDLVWLVAIESGFNPQAISPAGAAGLFQLMPETGERYGLTRSELVDDRLSITRGTRAGVTHLRDLFARYKQWDLALAAYNVGPERLDDALARLAERRGPRAAGKPVELKDLVEARLVPGETASFVPQVQAFAIVAANRGRFGLDDLDPAPSFEIGEIAVPGGTPLRLVARAAGVSVAVLRDYNPDLLRDQVPPGGEAIVDVPADRVSTAQAAFPALLAREGARLASASASASAAPPPAGTAAPRATASASASTSASASAPPRPSEPPVDRWQRAAEARRRALEKMPYGSSWLALGDRLFAPGHPLAGTVLVAPTLPPQSVIFAEQPRRGGLEGARVGPHPREERITVIAPVPSVRVLFGWIAPDAGDEGAAVRLAMIALAHHELGRVARALVVERHVAVHLRGILDLGERAGVVAIEAVPAVLHDIGDIEEELDRALAGFIERGPTPAELEAAKAQLRSRFQASRSRAGSADEPKEAALARIQRLADRAEALTGQDLQAMVKKVFAPEHRVVVTTIPRG